MSQRNPLNERYTSEKPLGKTRKSAASAKPTTTRAANVRDPAPKTKKQKRAEAREREAKIAARRGVGSGNNYTRGGTYDPPTPEYKRLRKMWWVCLGIGVAFALLTFVLMQNNMPTGSIYVMLGVSWVALIMALYLDLGKMRKIRKRYNAEIFVGKSKEARAQQKARAAEVREQKKQQEEAARLAEEQGIQPEPKKKGLAGLFGSKSKKTAENAADTAEAGTEEGKPAAAEKQPKKKIALR